MAVLIIGGCHNEEPQADHSRNTRLIEPPQRPLTVEGPAQDEFASNPELKPWVDMAVQDLATKLSAKPEDIDVREARYVTWPDSSLGCPKPGMQYMQVLTEGTRLVLKHEEKLYSYHGDLQSRVFLCERPGKPPMDHGQEATR